MALSSQHGWTRFYQAIEGQNLLINDQAILTIVDSLRIDPDRDRILEIGAGTGNVTYPLAERGAPVIAIEKDPWLYLQLQDRCRDVRNLTPVFGDFFLTPEAWYPAFTQMPDVTKIVCNCPFAYATSIFARLFFIQFDIMICLLGDRQLDTMTKAIPELYRAYSFEPLRVVDSADFFPRPEWLTGATEGRLMRIWQVRRVPSPAPTGRSTRGDRTT